MLLDSQLKKKIHPFLGRLFSEKTEEEEVKKNKKNMRWFGSRRRRFISLHAFLFTFAIFTGFGLLVLTLRSVDPSTDFTLSAAGTIGGDDDSVELGGGDDDDDDDLQNISSRSESSSDDIVVENNNNNNNNRGGSTTCATVEEMGEPFSKGYNDDQMESLRVRDLIQHHFALQGASRVRELPPEQFCAHGFVLGKASEAGFGNEMYKILTAAALSIMLNRSLIIGQTRGKFPFGDYISYTNASFTLKEVKHLWRQNDCTKKYGRLLIMRTDDFEKPVETNVLCSNWRHWKQPIIWFEGTTDAVAAQFFLKNVHSEMSYAASDLFGDPGSLQSRPNVFGELMRVIISPSVNVQEAVNWVLGGGVDPDIVLHMRMLMNRSVRAVQAALSCIKKALLTYQHHVAKPRVVLVSDTPSLIKDITPLLLDSSEVLHFDYEMFKGNISSRKVNGAHQLEFRAKDWGPAPRWVAFVDFFLASRARHAVVSGAHRRVGTTYAQLIAALAAANQLGENSNSSTASSLSFLSSFQSNLLFEGLRNQVGWGHVWNRFAGSLSCRHQSTQCAFTPLLPPGWWDGDWQSPISRDVRRLEAFGVQLTDSGQVNESQLQSFCKSRKEVVKTIPICQVSSC